MATLKCIIRSYYSLAVVALGSNFILIDHGWFPEICCPSLEKILIFEFFFCILVYCNAFQVLRPYLKKANLS